MKIFISIFFFESKSITIADKVVNTIFDSTDILKTQPEIYKIDKQKTNNDGTFRVYSVYDYSISYQNNTQKYQHPSSSSQRTETPKTLMEGIIHIQKTFEKDIYIDKKINNREFEDCVFKNCDFSNSNFAYNSFLDCEFIDCNLSMTSLAGTSLKNVIFKNCKLLGIAFHECDDFLFQVYFEECALDYAVFSNKKMPKTKFINSSVKEVTFVGTNLTSSVFDNCNLDGAIFNDTQLAGVDFRTAYNYKIDPEFNAMRKAQFSTQGIAGLLDKYDIKIV